MNKFIQKNLFFLIFLALTVFAVYGQSVKFGYTDFDDKTLIFQNEGLILNLKNISEIFKTSCFYSNDFTYYRPVLSLSFLFESILFGTNIGTYRITNMMLFVLNIYLIYIYLRKLNFNKTVLKIILLLTAVHPVFVSCFVWIPARNDTLTMIFFMLSFINFTDYIKSSKNKFLFLHGLFFTAALFTKETSLVLIPLYVLFVYCFGLKITLKQTVSNLIILLPVSAMYLVLRNIAVAGLNFKDYFENLDKFAALFATGTMAYIYNLVMPENVPVMMYQINPDLQFIFAGVLVLSVLFLLYYKNFIDRKIIIFSVVWFVICLIPPFLSDDYLFLPHRILLPFLGIIIIAAATVNKIITKYGASKKYIIVFGCAMLFSYSYASYVQKYKYQNPDVFWTNAYIDAPKYYVACNGIAVRANDYGDFEKAQKFAYEAFICEKKYSNKSGLRSLLTLSEIFLTKGDTDNAETICLDIANIKFDIASNLRNLSQIYLIKNDIAKSIRYAQTLQSMYPNNNNYKRHLENLYKLKNK